MVKYKLLLQTLLAGMYCTQTQPIVLFCCSAIIVKVTPKFKLFPWGLLENILVNKGYQ